jgi:hypothetical protein
MLSGHRAFAPKRRSAGGGRATQEQVPPAALEQYFAEKRGNLANRRCERSCQFFRHEANVCVDIFRFVSIYFLMRDLK